MGGKDRKLSFENLIKEVIDKNLCNRCGGCVSFCSANSIGALKTGKDGLPEYKDRDKCLEGGICYLICPQTIELEEEVKSNYSWRFPMGNYLDVFSARSAEEKIREIATDGGVVTSLLCYLLETGKIDGAIVSKSAATGGRVPLIATDRDQLFETAGSYFDQSTHLDTLGKTYRSCFPIIKVINEFREKKHNVKRLALVGTPCQIKAVRKMQALNIIPSDLIIFTVGLFCLQYFSIDKLMEEEFCKTHNITVPEIKKINVKENYMAELRSGITITIPVGMIEKVARPACLVCDDFSNELADISVGGLGSEDGYTTVAVRTTVGKKFYSDALYNGYLQNKSYICPNGKKAYEKQLIDIIQKYSLMKRARSKRNR